MNTVGGHLTHERALHTFTHIQIHSHIHIDPRESHKLQLIHIAEIVTIDACSELANSILKKKYNEMRIKQNDENR